MRILTMLITGLFLLGAGVQGTLAQDAGPDATLALVGGRLIDGYGGPPVENSVILVSGNRIAAVGSVDTLPVPDGVQVVDTNGMTVMPGLIDLHVHFDILGHADYGYWFPAYEPEMRQRIMPLAAEIMLDAGVTSVRDLGADFDTILWLREQVNSGAIPGPRTFIAGPFLRKTATSYVSDDYVDTWVVEGPDDARAKVRRLVNEFNVDVIKTQDEALSREELAAIYDEAHSLDRRVASHIFTIKGIRTALQAGLGPWDTIEHIGEGPAPAYADDIVQMIMEQGVAMAPTIIAIDAFHQMTEFPELLDHPDWRDSLPAELWEDIHASYENFTSHPLYYRSLYHREARFSKLRQLYEAGARFVMASDSGTRGNPHHMAAWREMMLLHEMGMPPMEVIMASTRFGATVLGRDDLGTIREGNLADIIVVDGDPLSNMRAMRHVRHVIQDGSLVR